MINELKKEDLNDYFKIPIYYNYNKDILKQNIINDLELVETVDSSCNPIYSYFFNNDNCLSKKLIEQFSKYYTTDVQFLNENQQLLKEYKKLDKKYCDYSIDYKNITELWDELK